MWEPERGQVRFSPVLHGYWFQKYERAVVEVGIKCSTFNFARRPVLKGKLESATTFA
jgi:hypothetical protein